MAFDIFKNCANQSPVSDDGKPIGVNLGVALTMAKTKPYDPEILVELLLAAESGMLESVWAE